MGRADIANFTYQVRRANFRDLKLLVKGHSQPVDRVGLEAKNDGSLLNARDTVPYSFLVWQLSDLVVEVLLSWFFTQGELV